MLTAYKIENNLLKEFKENEGSKELDEAVWIDLVNPTKEEIHKVERTMGMPLPDTQKTIEIEASSHYEVYENGLQLNCLFMHRVQDTFQNSNVALLFNGKCLISLCAVEIPDIVSFRKQWQKSARENSDPLSIVVELLEIRIEKLADVLEEAYLSIESISRHIFQRDNKGLEDTIDDLSRQDDINGKIRLCLMDGHRDLNFMLRKGDMTKENLENTEDMLEDIKTLLSHNSYHSERIDFLLNAALGFINIEQNKIIKIFSIAAVVLMPPTVIASIYGMNFKHMPELSWQFGYPVSILLMIVAGISPYIFFKRKGWL